MEPTADGLTVRLRIDGRLRSLDPPVPVRQRDAVVSRVKLMAGLDIAERRLPQDGRIAHAVRGQEVDFRVATTPTAFGESVVVRVLDRAQVRLDFAALGFDEVAMTALRPQFAAPHGTLLVTGPTGSGKTTMLYAARRYGSQLRSWFLLALIKLLNNPRAWFPRLTGYPQGSIT